MRVPAGSVALPGAWQAFLWFLQDNLYAGIPILVFLGMFALWWTRGRDPKVGSVAPEYKPIPGLGPAEAGSSSTAGPIPGTSPPGSCPWPRRATS